MKWKEMYERMSVRELEMVNLLPWNVPNGEINTFVLELQLFLQESEQILTETYSKVCVELFNLHVFQVITTSTKIHTYTCIQLCSKILNFSCIFRFLGSIIWFLPS